MRWPAAPSYRTAEMSLSAGSMRAKEIFAGGSVRASTPEIPLGCTMHSPCRIKSLNEMLCVLIGCSQPHSSCCRPLYAPLASPVWCLTLGARQAAGICQAGLVRRKNCLSLIAQSIAVQYSPLDGRLFVPTIASELP